MSKLRRWLGIQSFEEIRREADGLFEARDLGAAKLAYERAIDHAKERPPETVAMLRERIATCKDGIAEARLAEAERYLALGDVDLARAEIEGAIEIAESTEVAREAEARLGALDTAEAPRDDIPDPEQAGDEDMIAALAATWEDAQADEYDGYGQELERGLVALHSEKAKEAREILEGLLESANAPCYLWLEIGRACILASDPEGGRAALEEFLARVDPEDRSEARLAAYLELSHLENQEGRFEGAVNALERAVEALEDDPRPLFWMGRFLRQHGHHAEAADVLEAAAELGDPARPDWGILQELGIAQAEAEQHDAAIETLEKVIALFTDRRSLDYPPATATALARLHERAENRERAADLFQALARGSDIENHARYYGEAARLMEELGRGDEARRLLQRGVAVAPEGSELRADLEHRLEPPAESP